MDGFWKYKHFSFNYNYLNYTFDNKSWSISRKGLNTFGHNSNGYYEVIGGLGSARIEYIKKLRSEHHEAIKWMIEKLKISKNKGFYDDVVDFLKNIK